MGRAWGLALVVLASASTTGCEYLPETDAFETARGKEAVAKLLIDPASAQFRNVLKAANYVCGEINGKNRMGGFVGFKRFIVAAGGKDPQIDPEFELSSLFEAEDSCSSAQSSTYSSESTRRSLCERAEEQRAAQVLQALFDNAWSAHCSLQSNRSVFRPALNDALSEADPDENVANAADSNSLSAANSNASSPEATTADSEYEDDGPSELSATGQNSDPTQAPDEPNGSPDETELDRIFGGTPPSRDADMGQKSEKPDGTSANSL